VASGAPFAPVVVTPVVAVTLLVVSVAAASGSVERPLFAAIASRYWSQAGTITAISAAIASMPAKATSRSSFVCGTSVSSQVDRMLPGKRSSGSSLLPRWLSFEISCKCLYRSGGRGGASAHSTN